MKKLTLLFLLLPVFASAQNVNIPDANFKAYLVADTTINTNGDAEIQVSEANAYTGLINVSNMNISDLTGIGEFTKITTLDCEKNQLTSLDVSNNSALKHLECGWNDLTSIDVSNNTALNHFDCAYNSLTSLDVNNNTALTYLECDHNSIISLDVSNNTALRQFYCNSNKLTSLDFRLGTNYDGMSVRFNFNDDLTCISVDDFIAASSKWNAPNVDTWMFFAPNCSVADSIVYIPDSAFKACLVNNSSINKNGDDEIQLLEAQTFTGEISVPNKGISDLTGIEALSYISGLNCSKNALTSIDLSQHKILKTLNCSDNLIDSLDVSNSSIIELLYISNNLLTNLELSSTKWYLEGIRCDSNKLSNLDLSNYTSIKELTCTNNLLENLDLRNGYNEKLVVFDATSNANLECISVDDATSASANWSTNIDAHATFSNACDVGIEENALSEVSITSLNNSIIINCNDCSKGILATIYNLTGQQVHQQELNGFTSISLDKGIYLVRVIDGGQRVTEKVYLGN